MQRNKYDIKEKAIRRLREEHRSLMRANRTYGRTSEALLVLPGYASPIAKLLFPYLQELYALAVEFRKTVGHGYSPRSIMESPSEAFLKTVPERTRNMLYKTYTHPADEDWFWDMKLGKAVKTFKPAYDSTMLIEDLAYDIRVIEGYQERNHDADRKMQEIEKVLKQAYGEPVYKRCRCSFCMQRGPEDTKLRRTRIDVRAETEHTYESFAEMYGDDTPDDRWWIRNVNDMEYDFDAMDPFRNNGLMVDVHAVESLVGRTPVYDADWLSDVPTTTSFASAHIQQVVETPDDGTFTLAMPFQVDDYRSHEPLYSEMVGSAFGMARM